MSKKKRIFTVYLVYSEHYLGIDGTYIYNIAGYTTKESALRKKERLQSNCDHINSPYDVVTYKIEEIKVYGNRLDFALNLLRNRNKIQDEKDAN